MNRLSVLSWSVLLLGAAMLSGCSLLIPSLKPMPATAAGVTFREKVEQVARAEGEKKKRLDVALVGACLAHGYARQAAESAESARKFAEDVANRRSSSSMRRGEASVARNREQSQRGIVALGPVVSSTQSPLPSPERSLQTAAARPNGQTPLTGAELTDGRQIDDERDKAREQLRADKKAPPASAAQKRQGVPDSGDGTDQASAQTEVPDKVYESCMQDMGNASAPDDVDLTLRHVRVAFGEIYRSIDVPLMQKHSQQYVYREAATFSGGLAASGGLAKELNAQRAGVLGLLVFMGLEQLYAPAETKKVHLRAEKMFSCLSSEIGKFSETDRKAAERSTTDGAIVAADAVNIVIGKVDEAIVTYRAAILSQEPGSLSKADFERFVKDYSTALANEAAAKKDALTAAATVADADKAAAKFVALPTNMEACLKAFPS